METIKNYLKGTYHLSNYQIAQLGFLMKTIASEMSKLLIMGALFHNHLSLYTFALIIMLCLRCTTGGLHFYTYTGCLAASMLYMGLALILLPHIKLNHWFELLLLAGCILICYLTGPVTSKYRPVSTNNSNFQKWRITACLFIFFYSLAMYIIPENIYLTVGFWIIILHSLQLLVAKIKTKGEH